MAGRGFHGRCEEPGLRMIIIQVGWLSAETLFWYMCTDAKSEWDVFGGMDIKNYDYCKLQSER